MVVPFLQLALQRASAYPRFDHLPPDARLTDHLHQARGRALPARVLLYALVQLARGAAQVVLHALTPRWTVIGILKMDEVNCACVQHVPPHRNAAADWPINSAARHSQDFLGVAAREKYR